MKRSFYIFLFQTPLAEMAVSADGHEFLDRLWADWSPGYDGSWDVARVKESLGDPANLAAAIGYYRALFDPSQHSPTYDEAQEASASISSTAHHVPPRCRRRGHGCRCHRRRPLPYCPTAHST